MVTGTLTVKYTEFSGSECTAEEQAEAGKGATFTYTVTRHDGPIPRWSECILPQSTGQDDTCNDYCARQGGACSLSCSDSGPLRTASDCNSSIWVYGPQDCSAGLWTTSDQAARCCCE